MLPIHVIAQPNGIRRAPGDFQRVPRWGLPRTVEEQIAQATIDDSACDQRFAALGFETREVTGGAMDPISERRI